MEDAKRESDADSNQDNQDAPSVDETPLTSGREEEEKKRDHAQRGWSRGRGFMQAPLKRFFSQQTEPRRGDTACASSMP